ncbi:MAG: hypothetical protein M3345_00580 [Actinomycetota bacterium]|nr:hypothetical protein [Actinomycetota bacterium]
MRSVVVGGIVSTIVAVPAIAGGARQSVGVTGDGVGAGASTVPRVIVIVAPA